MAYVWLDSEGTGVSVQETAANVRSKIEEDPEQAFIELLRAPEEGEEAFRTIFLDKASIVAVESGSGVGAEEAV